MGSASRWIKKYPNRRLYDTEVSRYITLDDVRRLVQQDIEFTVVDKTTEADITRQILLQVITEQEQWEHPVMSQQFLQQLIRSYGTPLQKELAVAMEAAVRQRG